MKIVITGSSGFVGRNLINYFQKSLFEIIALQRKNQKCPYFIRDLNDGKNLSKILSGADVIIHCASKVHCFDKSKNDLDEYRKVNVMGTKNLAKYAIKNGVKRFIFISSIKVNGESTANGELFKIGSKINPVDNYALSKYEAEKELLELSKKSRLEVVIIRPTLIYGPGVKANFLNLMKLIKFGFPLPFKNIKNKRSILYIENLAALIKECITSKYALNKILLAADPMPLSTNDLIQLISKTLQSKILLFNVPDLFWDIFSKIPILKNYSSRLTNSLEVDALETMELLKFKMPFSSEKGLIKTSNWFKKLP